MITRRIEISRKTIIFTAIFIATLAIFWQIRTILVMIFVSFVLMQAVNPIVRRLEKIKIPRFLAILITYIFILAVVAFTVAGIVPILIEQTTGLINSLPQIIKNINIFSQNNIDLTSQFKILESVPSNVAKIAMSIVSNIFSSIIILVLTFYLLLEKNNFPKYAEDFFGNRYKDKLLKIIGNIESTLGSWVSAELLLMTIIGLISYFGYLILGLKYAVPLALLAGLLEAVPSIGPTIATVLAGLVALTVSPLTSLFTVIFGILVQQLENSFIVPKIMSKTVDLNPLITIILIASGAQLAGVMGALLAIPLFLTARAIIKGLSKESQ